MSGAIAVPRAVLFDLDGTLADSLPDIAWALDAARRELGLPGVTPRQVRGWVGAGAAALVARSLDAADEHDPRVVPLLERFLAHYTAHADERTRLFRGVSELLAALRGRGVRLAVTTNKPRAASDVLLDGLGVRALFDAVVTPETAGAKKPDPRLMAAALAALGVAANDALVVGDGEQDVLAAKAAGIPCVAILGGYGDRAALVAARPHFTVESIEELRARLGV